MTSREVCSCGQGFLHATDIQGLPPTLTVSVTGDPLTPHQGGISLAETLGGSLQTVEGAQHGSLITGLERIDSVVVAYRVEVKTPPAGGSCRM
ncbi:alpha/beta hydrolase [Arthrobacter sp. CG_A4]|uniref:alpha/beta hydrolase n=1 Tax=Arthrobacter sp. CG_A4 TaxID=3071706 RepID=UPI003FA3C91C